MMEKQISIILKANWSNQKSIKAFFAKKQLLFDSNNAKINPQQILTKKPTTLNYLPNFYRLRALFIIQILMSIRKLKGRTQNYKVILVGDNGVGKTTLFKKCVDDDNKTPEQITTVDFRNKQLNMHDKEINLSIWDTAGQEKFRSVIATYFKSCQGVFFVFDLGNRASWSSIQTVWFEMASTYSPTASFLLIGNKTDITPEISRQEIQSWCKMKQVYYIQTSAMKGFQVSEALTMMAALVDKNQEQTASKQECGDGFSTEELVSETKSSSRRQTRDSTKAWHNGSRTHSFILKNYDGNDKIHHKCCK